MNYNATLKEFWPHCPASQFDLATHLLLLKSSFKTSRSVIASSYYFHLRIGHLINIYHHLNINNQFPSKRIMTRRNESKRVVTVCVAIFLVLLMMVEKTHQKASTVRSCLRSCHHCKNHFGNFFVAHLCAKTCTDLRGRLEINCKDIVSIAPFLDPMVLQHLSNNNIWFKKRWKSKNQFACEVIRG